jgi:hypothetical protein
MKKIPASRLNLPEVLNGRFTGLTVATYGADLAFLESFLLRRMARQITNRVLLVDAGQLHKAITLGHGFRRLNRTYATAPIHSSRSFHPKLLLLTGPESGRLLVGSGNASISGYTGPGEAFTQYDWTPEAPNDLAAFTAVRDFLLEVNQRFSIDDLAWHLIQDQLAVAEWINGDRTPSSVVHNLHEPLLNQLASRIDTKTVTELVIYAPFHDHGARAMKALIKQLRPTRLTLLVQSRQTTIDLPALKSVTRPLGKGLTVMEVEAPQPYSNVFLHAKFVLARTSSGDHILQGSANISAVALCQSSADGNVEMANLLSGPAGAFDAFLANVTTSLVANGLQEVIPAAWSDDNTADDANAWQVRNLTWAVPDLSGILTRIVDGSDIHVFISGRQLTPTVVNVQTEAGTTHFTITFSPEDAERLNQAEWIDIQIRDELPIPSYPYRVNELLRLSSTGHRIDLLREAGSLDLDDKEIVEILQELDRIMIVDGRSLWRLAHPSDPIHNSDEEDSNEKNIRYEDLDWDLIRAHPAYKGHDNARTNASNATATELAILLGSLTDRFRIDASEPSAGRNGPADDLAIEPDLEDEDAVDDALADVDADDAELEPRRQTASTRVRRMWRSFAQRFVRGLSDQNFVEQVGPGIVIPSYIAFNHLCRRLRITEMIDPDYLSTAQIHLWGFMWGTSDSVGYLASLPNDERHVAQEVMAQHEDISATLAAIDDAYWHTWDYADDIRPLRNAVRSLLANREWSLDQSGLVGAANATSTSNINTAEDLLDEIWELVVYAPEDDIDRDIASSVGLNFTDIHWKKETIMRNGVPREHEVLHIRDDFDLSMQRAGALFSAWACFDPGNDYLRVVAGRTIAFWEGEERGGLLFNRDTGVEEVISLAETEQPPWLTRINELSLLLVA